jgi:hypothetical protein
MPVRPAVAVRLREEVIAGIDALAKANGTSRQVVMEAFIEAGLVRPVLPARPVVPKPVVPDRDEEREAYERVQGYHLARQAKLNEAKARAAR